MKIHSLVKDQLGSTIPLTMLLSREYEGGEGRRRRKLREEEEEEEETERGRRELHPC